MPTAAAARPGWPRKAPPGVQPAAGVCDRAAQGDVPGRSSFGARRAVAMALPAPASTAVAGRSAPGGRHAGRALTSGVHPEFSLRCGGRARGHAEEGVVSANTPSRMPVREGEQVSANGGTVHRAVHSVNPVAAGSGTSAPGCPGRAIGPWAILALSLTRYRRVCLPDSSRPLVCLDCRIGHHVRSVVRQACSGTALALPPRKSPPPSGSRVPHR